MSVVAERKYAMTRVRAGDYLFPSNDGTRIWRVYRYQEDGTLDGGDTGWYWATARFDGTIEQAERLVSDDPGEFLSWSSWEFWSSPHPTRADAIASAVAA